MYPKSVVFLGAGQAVREIFWYFKELYPESPIAFVDDMTPRTEMVFDGVAYPVVKDWDFAPLRRQYPNIEGAFTEFIIGVAEPPTKKIVFEKAIARGLQPAPTLISKTSVVRPDCSLGRGGVIMSSSISPGADIGDCALVMFSTFGCDVHAGDYITCYTGCHVGTEVVLGEGVALGASCGVMERVQIAPWVKTGQGASVVKNVAEEGITIVGVPARKITKSV